VYISRVHRKALQVLNDLYAIHWQENRTACDSRFFVSLYGNGGRHVHHKGRVCEVKSFCGWFYLETAFISLPMLWSAIDISEH